MRGAQLQGRWRPTKNPIRQMIVESRSPLKADLTLPPLEFESIEAMAPGGRLMGSGRTGSLHLAIPDELATPDVATCPLGPVTTTLTRHHVPSERTAQAG